MIGSNMAQTAIMMHPTEHLFIRPLCSRTGGCSGRNVPLPLIRRFEPTFTSDIKETLTDAKYVVSSGGAARKAGMTREDLLKGNAAIAEEFGKNVKPLSGCEARGCHL